MRGSGSTRRSTDVTHIPSDAGSGDFAPLHDRPVPFAHGELQSQAAVRIPARQPVDSEAARVGGHADVRL
jgi:hypothetical protein